MAAPKPPILKAADLDQPKRERLYTLLSDLHDATTEQSSAAMKVDAAKAALKEEFFPQLDEGTSNVTLEFGKKLIIVQPIYRKVDAALLDVAITEQKLTAAEVNAVVKYKAECSVSGWKALDLETRKKFGDIITELPGAVSFKIENIKS